MAAENIYTVTMLNEYADRVLKNDLRLRSLKVSGEISGFKRHCSGHLYFTLKDESSSVSCVMFRSNAASLRIEPKDGMQVVVQGNASIFPRDGKFQFYVNSMRSFGQGELYIRFLMLKERLEAEGVFANARPLPRLPRAIGIATSRTGAALHDMLNVIGRRFPEMKVVFAPCTVQGPGAPEEIAAAVNRLAASSECDVMIVGRGGGSYEDLYCFNDERVARAIASSPIPVVSAVGHETDFTIADFAADLRAPTPSAAAELCCPIGAELRDEVRYDKETLERLVADRLSEARSRLQSAASSSAMANPRHAVTMLYERLEARRSALDNGVKNALAEKEAKLSVSVERLRAIGPKEVLRRGYSIVTDEKGRILSGVSSMASGQRIGVIMNGGRAEATVTKVERENDNE
ncbi:MAG: exodeoxyribonuclease VII large subunit [Clostridia bacterium]|nr:exodeoxyribonuclease VII large subunit [Clostridia bacterium]